jgi:diguanylate cyclase (GGDEF)-like protein
MAMNQMYTRIFELPATQESNNTGRQLSQSSMIQNWSAVESTLQTVKDGIIIIDNSGQVDFMNIAAEQLMSWQFSKELPTSISSIFQSSDPTFLGDFKGTNGHSITHKGSQETATNQQMSLTVWNGRELLIEYSKIPVQNQQKEQTNTILVFREYCKKHQLSEMLSPRNGINLLTGLMNRHSFAEHLEKALNFSVNSGTEHTLCQLDLDRFKIINETCGHVAGDEFLRQVSTILQRRVRKSDILAYLESDKFALILYHCNLDQALQVLESMREEIYNFRFVWQDEIFRLSLSIGAVMLSGEHNSSIQALSAAGSACNAAKSSGRNRIHIAGSNDVEVKTQQGESQWVLKILKALEENQFRLYQQTIIPLASTVEQKSNHKSNCEILIRLLDESNQVIPPGNFLPAAEKYGLMPMIDRWVIQNLFQHLAAKIKQPRDAKTSSSLTTGSSNNQISDCFYTVNLSGASLNDDQFLDYIHEQFKLFSIPPELICFEITETIAISSFSQAAQFILQLKEIGCHFALDDFGSGMSSFGYLQQLPVDYLKIDGMFIKEILKNPTACEIVEAINRIAHVMGIQTVAEWVENDQMLSKVRHLGIDFAQGFGIAKPQPLI